LKRKDKENKRKFEEKKEKERRLEWEEEKKKKEEEDKKRIKMIEDKELRRKKLNEKEFNKMTDEYELKLKQMVENRRKIEEKKQKKSLEEKKKDEILREKSIKNAVEMKKNKMENEVENDTRNIQINDGHTNSTINIRNINSNHHSQNSSNTFTYSSSPLCSPSSVTNIKPNSGSSFSSSTSPHHQNITTALPLFEITQKKTPHKRNLSSPPTLKMFGKITSEKKKTQVEKENVLVKKKPKIITKKKEIAMVKVKSVNTVIKDLSTSELDRKKVKEIIKKQQKKPTTFQPIGQNYSKKVQSTPNSNIHITVNPSTSSPYPSSSLPITTITSATNLTTNVLPMSTTFLPTTATTNSFLTKSTITPITATIDRNPLAPFVSSNICHIQKPLITFSGCSVESDTCNNSAIKCSHLFKDNHLLSFSSVNGVVEEKEGKEKIIFNYKVDEEEKERKIREIIIKQDNKEFEVGEEDDSIIFDISDEYEPNADDEEIKNDGK
jgi:hypothetical protein